MLLMSPSVIAKAVWSVVSDMTADAILFDEAKSDLVWLVGLTCWM